MCMWAQPVNFDMCMLFTRNSDFGDKTLVRREDAALAFSASQNFTMIFFPPTKIF